MALAPKGRHRHRLLRETLTLYKLRGWKVQPVQAKGHTAAAAAAAAALGDLRDNDVSKMKAQTWRHRGKTCLYTQLQETDVVKLSDENDHVWECQLVNLANARAAEGQGVGVRTRAVQDTLKRVVNGVHNLNVTTHTVNQAKKGPFSKFQHHYATGSGAMRLDDLVSASSSQNVLKLRDDGTWARIERAVVDVHGELAREAARITAKNRRLYVQRVVAELGTMAAKMDIL